MSKILDAFEGQQHVLRKIIARYRPNPADVDEIAQETFLKGFAAELDNEIHEPEHFLMRVAKNLAIKHAQKKVNSTGVSIEDLGGSSVFLDDRQVSQVDSLDARQKLVILTKGLASLSPELKSAFVMRRIEGLKYKQIATRLNVSVSTVEKRVAAAMVDIHIYLREQGYDPAEFGALPQAVKRQKSATLTASQKTYGL
ncbi:RNA polymerase sigma factor [Hirschia litorea]|uniref:RNA polymerase sigma factor n=1 Tax=Hirschia litorea TaxID=1199156 RepID=A0ABW2INE1_9PROT